ncbi:HET domain-containing protein [Ophiostoma piceae UAMH 11346]|uniref:HET domain-containing protein n=1 Tax=Ophiostoma piceae (strain UAMH 11346) TaxID=1262450 RepID=S3D6H4_OPHP1|nr:HET domain-containing protein [Ophiostoma piceae UAMH 11346]
MRLINTKTLIQREFNGQPGRDIPPYAILSHTWTEDEISYREFSRGVSFERQSSTGFLKIQHCCSVARGLGINWAWIDTCCIDKSSSAELSEAINSMFNWYTKSTVCIAHLSDVKKSPALITSANEFEFYNRLISGSRWFTRGWTLQELLAPRYIYFYDSQWQVFGDKISLKLVIAKISTISVEALTDTSNNWDKYSLAERFSWAAHRETTRVEDAAYSLMGLFGVNLPLLYGEGSKAFLRLQETIIQKSSYVNHFQVTGSTLSFDQLILGPVSRIRVQNYTQQGRPAIPCVTAMQRVGKDRLDAVRVRTSVYLKGEIQSDVDDGWRSFEDINVVYIMPLLCAVDGNAICVLLSQPKPYPGTSATEPFRRLHSPSLVSLHPKFLEFLKRPRDRLHAQIHYADNASTRGLHLSEPQVGRGYCLQQHINRYGYPRVYVLGKLEKDYMAYSMYIGRDGVLSTKANNDGLPVKQLVAFLHKDTVDSWEQPRSSDSLSSDQSSDTSPPMPSFSIALHGDKLSVATFEDNYEPLLSRLRELPILPQSVCDPDTNPFLDMPGLVQTKEFDVWALRRAWVPDLHNMTIKLETEVEDGHRVILVYFSMLQ